MIHKVLIYKEIWFNGATRKDFDFTRHTLCRIISPRESITRRIEGKEALRSGFLTTISRQGKSEREPSPVFSSDRRISLSSLAY